MELCEVNNDFPEIAGIVLFESGLAGHKAGLCLFARLLLSFVQNPIHLLGVSL